MLYFSVGHYDCNSNNAPTFDQNCAYIFYVKLNETSGHEEVHIYAGVGSVTPKANFYTLYESSNGNAMNPRDRTYRTSTALVAKHITFRANGDLYFYDSYSFTIRVIVAETGMGMKYL